MRCEGGAHWATGGRRRRPRLIYACPAAATVALATPELVIALWCDAHATTLAPSILAWAPEWSLQPFAERTGTPAP